MDLVYVRFGLICLSLSWVSVCLCFGWNSTLLKFLSCFIMTLLVLHAWRYVEGKLHQRHIWLLETNAWSFVILVDVFEKDYLKIILLHQQLLKHLLLYILFIGWKFDYRQYMYLHMEFHVVPPLVWIAYWWWWWVHRRRGTP